MQPRDHMIGWLSANIPDIIIDPDISGFDIKGRINSGELKIFYQIEVIEEWEDEWPVNWEEIRLPSKNKILIDQWHKSYRDDMLTFIVYRKDLKKAWHIAGDIAMESEINR